MWTRRTYGPPPGSVRLEPLTDEEAGRSKTTDERQGNTGSRQPGEAFLEPVVQGWRSWNLSSHLTLKARGRPERCCLPTPGAWPDCRLLSRASLPTGRIVRGYLPVVPTHDVGTCRRAGGTMDLERMYKSGARRPLVAGGVALAVLAGGGVAVAASLA